jgi:methionyl-tRNA formyltransferase
VFDTIILLAGTVEQPVLASVLRAHHPQLTVVPVLTPDDLAAIEANVLRRARLIAFTTDVIVPPQVLDQLGYGAYNFHPGPPQYPGWAPAHFALYDQVSAFGATLHVMVGRVDAGPIVGVARFAVPADIGVVGLEQMAYVTLVGLFRKFAKVLASSAEPPALSRIPWGGRRNSRRAYAAICDIPLNIRKDELEHRLKVFGANHYGICPTVHLHGIPFRAVTPDSAEA